MCITENENETGVKVPNGQINYNTVAGSLGLASFLGINAGGLFGRGLSNNSHPDVSNYVTQKEMDYEKQIIDLKSQNAIQTSNQYTDGHIIEAYKDTVARFKEADAALQAEIKENMVNRINNEKQLAVLQTQIACLEQRLSAADASTNQKLDYEVRGVYREIDNAKVEMRGAIALESERRECGDTNLYNYVNGTFVPGKLVMPIDNVCPQPMQRYNSWTAPTTTTTTTE